MITHVGKVIGAPLAALLLLAPATGGAAELDEVERRMARVIADGQPRDLALLAETVDINSGTMNFDGVRRVGDRFAVEFRELGFAVRWIDGTPFGRAGHLVAERGDRGPKVLLIGHLDTVFEPDSPFQRWERIAPTAARGPGVTDMKGGNVVMLAALRALAAVGVLDELRIAVVLTGDEERSGRPLDLARQALREAADGAAYAIGFEDGDSDPETAVIARRGSSSWRLEVSAVTAHSSQIFQPEVGHGAIYEVARVLEGFRRSLAPLTDLTFNPGLVVGGTDVDFDAAGATGRAYGKNNVIAAGAVVTGDLRATSPAQLEEAKALMRSVVDEPLAGATSTLEISDGYPPMAPSDGNRELLAMFDAASRDLGYGPVAAVDPRNAGAADVSFVAPLVPRVLDGVGLMGRGGHTEDEVADLATLPMQASRVAVLLYRIARP